MPTLNINGKRVTVDDSFLSLSPEQQNATVDEIAASFDAAPSAVESGMAELSGLTRAAGQASQHDVDTKVRAEMEASKLQQIMPKGTWRDFNDSAMGSIPFQDRIFSATLGNVGRMVRDHVGPVEAYQREMALQEALRAQREKRSPVASTLGMVSGALGTGGVATKGGLTLIGRVPSSAGLWTRVGAGAAESAAYGGLYGASGAESVADMPAAAVTGALTGGVTGAAIPLLGAGLRATGNKIASGMRTVLSPEKEASARVLAAMSRDAGRVAVNQADEATAAINAQPIMNVDRGGETVRALARASSNASPEARAALERTISDRFGSQSNRAVRLLQRITGGAIDDLALQDSIRASAKVSNKKAYDAVLNSSKAGTVYTKKLQELMQAPAIREAVSSVPATSANRTLKDIKNPFEINSKGIYVLRQKADGTLIAPNLAFWDHVKRNLDDAIGVASRTGKKSTYADLVELKRTLVNELDSVVPAYKAARAGAWAAFGAEDAIEAGRNFAKVSRNTGEMQRAIKTMTAPERKAFQTGFASEMVDIIKAARDRTNVIDGMFNRPEAREKMIMAFGPVKAREIEAFVRVEGAMDLMRNALGNSTTARQLVELGMISGAGGAYGLTTGDFGTGAAVSAGLAGLKYGRAKLDQRVLRKVAEMLVSRDEAALRRIIQNSAASPQYLRAVAAITDAAVKLAPPATGFAAGALANQ